MNTRIWDDSFTYFEFQISSTGFKLRVNGVLEFESTTPPSTNPTKMGLTGIATSSERYAYYDDIYISTDDGLFHGPIQIDDATNVSEINSINYTPNSGTNFSAINSTDTTSWVATTNSSSEYVVKCTVTNATGFLIHSCSLNTTSQPYGLAATQGENALNMHEVASYPLTTAFNARRSFVSAASILDQGNPTDENGEYRYFGFKVKEL